MIRQASIYEAFTLHHVVNVCVHALPCLTLCDPSDGSLLGSLSMWYTVCSKSPLTHADSASLLRMP